MKTRAFFKGLSFFVCSAFALFLLSVSIVNAQAPGGTITAVDAKTGVVTGKVNSTGQVFTFTLANKALLNGVHPGQGVFVNLAKKQVSLDGKQPHGTILTLLPLIKKPGSSTGSSTGSNASSGSGSSGTTGNSTSPPPPCSIPNTWPPNTQDTYGKAFQLATMTCFTASCGASATISGNTYPVGSSDWLAFTVPASRANCVDYSGQTPSPFIQVFITSDPAAVIVFDAQVDASTFITAGNSTRGPSPTPAQGDFFAQLGTAYSPLKPGTYYIRVYAPKASTGTWTLTLKG